MEFALNGLNVLRVYGFKFSILGFVEIMFAGARGSRCRSFSCIARCACFFSLFSLLCENEWKNKLNFYFKCHTLTRKRTFTVQSSWGR